MIELIEKFKGAGEAGDNVTLPYELRQRSRQRLRLDSGREAALLLPHGTVLDDGDYLRAADGTTVKVAAAIETIAIGRTADPLRLARACYHLGNRHVPLQVGDGWIGHQVDHVLEEMVRGLGLMVTHESVCFQPERGAYDGHAHAHPHDSGGPHSHGHHH